jgi:hypothetical protein
VATLSITVAAGGEFGASMRQFGLAIEKAVANVPDKNSTGASCVLTIDNAPTTGVVSVQVTAGPYTGPLVIA